MTLTHKIEKQCSETKARACVITTARGEIKTPVFMPVGTKATVKAMTPELLEQIGAQIILGNTYHLYLRPGHELIEKAGGLHRFMAWNKPILTDSGGFQVFSLATLRKIQNEGVSFQSHIDGSKHFLTPELSIQIQQSLGSDIMMSFDECPALPATRDTLAKSWELTKSWERRSLAQTKVGENLFSIIQGGSEHDLRRQSLDDILAIEASFENEGKQFAGHAIGGLSVGEPNEVMYEVVDQLACHMPANKPRYLMGVGTPEDLITCIGLGVDMFDCVMPTRNARNGMLFTASGDIKIRQARYKEDFTPIDESCSCSVCAKFSRAYIRHLHLSDEILASILCTIHNLHYYSDLIAKCRQSILNESFTEFKKQFLANRSS